MKYLVMVIVIQFLILSNEVLQAQWVQTNGPNRGIVHCFAVSGINIFAGSDSGGVYLSTNNGSDWALVNNDLANTFVYSLAVSGAHFFAGTDSSVFFSTNNGISWAKVNNGLPGFHVNAIAVSGTNIFAGTDAGLFHLTNDNTYWTPVSNDLSNTAVTSIIVNENNIYAGIWEAGVVFSTDNGANWTQIINGMTKNPCIYSLIANGNNIYAGSIEGLYYSSNNGADWTLVNNGLTSHVVLSLIVSGNNIFVGTWHGSGFGGGVFLSTNNGINWTFVGLPNTTIYSLTISGSNVIASTEPSGVWIRPLSELTGISKEITDLSKDFTLSQNYPNPFNPSTVISYALPAASNIKLIVYNTLGQTVKVLETGFKQAGNYSVNFNAANLPSGIYFCKLEAEQFSQIKKMILIK